MRVILIAALFLSTSMLAADGELEIEQAQFFTSDTCVACKEDPALYTVVPCLHRCYCQACAEDALEAELEFALTCPMCRKHVGTILEPDLLLAFQKGDYEPEFREKDDEDICFRMLRCLCCCFLLDCSLE